MNIDNDLQRILNVGAKVYHTATKKQGKVYSNNGIDIIVDYGKGNKYETYSIEDFSELLISDTIVANSRVTLAAGDKEEFRIKPREALHEGVKVTISDNLPRDLIIPAKSTPQDEQIQTSLETGYINFTTQKFSVEPKKGYTKVEYKKSTEKITLELTSEQIERLKEMGLVW